MSPDTIEANQRAGTFAGCDELWLFGYGSLIYKAGFDYTERRPATVTGWARRFWQGSHDHRGTPESPGRVVTLVKAPGETCFGMAYRITPAEFAYLDHREKNGYRRFVEPITFADGRVDKGLIYIAASDNSAWLGEAPIDDIARQIVASSGPSGSNRDYVLCLADALRRNDATDAHVFAVSERVDELIKANDSGDS